MKAIAVRQGDAPSPGTDPPREQVYCQRGDVENRIKELHDGMQTGRTAPIRGVEFILGSGRFIGPKTLEVTLADGKTCRLHGTNAIVSTGSHASLEGITGLVEAAPLTHIEALELDEVPKHLFVIDGGYVGWELSQVKRRFGSNVTLIDRNERLMHEEGDDVSEDLQKLLEDE